MLLVRGETAVYSTKVTCPGSLVMALLTSRKGLKILLLRLSGNSCSTVLWQKDLSSDTQHNASNPQKVSNIHSSKKGLSPDWISLVLANMFQPAIQVSTTDTAEPEKLNPELFEVAALQSHLHCCPSGTDFGGGSQQFSGSCHSRALASPRLDKDRSSIMTDSVR